MPNLISKLEKNYINLKSSELDTPIYRIFPKNRLLEILRTNNMALVKPSVWDDPLENTLLKSKLKYPNGIIAKMTSEKSVFCQCWTTNQDSDAMWRIYSQKNDGLKVKSSPRKILNALAKNEKIYAEDLCFIGKVIYKNINDIFDEFQYIDPGDFSGKGIARSLLFKRLAFQHENEIRLIYAGLDSDENLNKNIHIFKLDPNDIFEEIIIDPRSNRDLQRKLTKQIKDLNYKGIIEKSDLYGNIEPVTIEIKRPIHNIPNPSIPTS
jgi:hypothetical protein